MWVVAYFDPERFFFKICIINIMQLFSADATICFKRNVYNPFVIFCWVLIGKNNASILKKNNLYLFEFFAVRITKNYFEI